MIPSLQQIILEILSRNCSLQFSRELNHVSWFYQKPSVTCLKKRKKTFILILTCRFNGWVIQLRKMQTPLTVWFYKTIMKCLLKGLHQCCISSKKLSKYYDAHTLMPHWIYICMAGQHKFMVNTNLWRTIVSFQNNPHIFKLLVMFDMQHNFDPLPFFKGGVNFNYLAGGIWKIRQGWKYSVGAAFLKGGGGGGEIWYLINF